jgi:hypothetical protein
MIACLVLAHTAKAQESTPSNKTHEDLRDYSQHDFTVNIDMIRAGAHDESNTNDYYFVGSIYGLVNTAAERKKTFEEKPKVEGGTENFGSKQISSLDYWRSSPNDNDTITYQVTGDQIRDLVANTMKTHSVSENDVAVRVNIELWEVGKKFVFFGEDTKISETHFFPIPLTKFDTPARTNQSLEMNDDKGSQVIFSVTYTNPLTAEQAPKK